MSLWTIKKEYEIILNDIIDDDGVVSEQADHLLQINAETRDDTATNYYYIINNLEHENGNDNYHMLVDENENNSFKRKIMETILWI